MYAPNAVFLLTLLTTASFSSAAAVSDAAVAAACLGFQAGTFKCLTDVSYVVCRGPNVVAVEQFVAAGTRCVQGEYGKKVDAIEGVVATATRTFTQVDPSGVRIGSPVVPITATAS